MNSRVLRKIEGDDNGDSAFYFEERHPDEKELFALEEIHMERIYRMGEDIAEGWVEEQESDDDSHGEVLGKRPCPWP